VCVREETEVAPKMQRRATAIAIAIAIVSASASADSSLGLIFFGGAWQERVWTSPTDQYPWHKIEEHI